MLSYKFREEHCMFRKSIGSVLRCFQCYSNCDLEKDQPSYRLTLLGKRELKQPNQALNQNFAKEGGEGLKLTVRILLVENISFERSAELINATHAYHKRGFGGKVSRRWAIFVIFQQKNSHFSAILDDISHDWKAI